MNTFKCFAALFMVTILSIFTGCNQDSSADLSGDTGRPQLIDPANPANPFDYIGAQHNDGLAYLRENFQSQFEELNAASPGEAEQYIFQRSAEFGGSDPALHMALRKKLQLRENELLRDFRFDNYQDLFKRLGIEERTSMELQECLGQIMETEPGTVEAANTIIKAIRNCETHFTADPTLADRDFALTLLAVWRYSIYYWTDHFILDGNPDGPTTRAKWWQIGLADAACGAVGFLLGGPGAGVSLGLGASKLVADNIK